MNEQGSNDFRYISKYPRILKIVEEVCNIYIIISLFIVGLESHTYYLFLVVSLVAFVTTAILLANMYFVVIEMNTRYFWIEFGYEFTFGILIAIIVTILVASSQMRRGYILVYITGFTTAILYFADALDKYRSAINSRRKLCWNRPVQVLYEEE